ncbi:4-(cytidine 5'-diphospho)-2-C-methyl-D-erythritol kinase [Govanella unica]|uniref:4-diphosphocytidyl-2-C-methyl-D-erythritol kinase n=1 Tax=Govanella unica TaxID=2975056 RepID=A0A9X3TXF4_9PROT|nr:4-(cytidine 5'-diphospho)-2-C-methyl-D-erythritol kinase [Govania unica]MDA5193389.1 4-(cytidine 5'-diphospho)-2-C-methyl-D-erythritol kinase [Govania unica]
MVEEFAPAKINLTLSITGRRDDGYHLLDSLFLFANVGDRVTARPADGLSLEISGPRGVGLVADPAENLVLKAARLLQAEAGLTQGAALNLEKHLPLASGIGGGSADAAATLRALNRLWSLGLGLDDLARIGARVGADVPAAVHSIPLRVEGIGEKLTPIGPLPPFGILLVNPAVSVPTPAVFAAFNASGTSFAMAAEALPSDPRALLAVLHRTPNMLEAPAITLQPVIAELLQRLVALPGGLLTRMSGSGATCFTLYPSPEGAEQAAVNFAAEPGWWVWGGGLYNQSHSL